MLGWRLLRESELALQKELADAKRTSLQSELDAAKAYIAKCEALISNERGRIEAERERGDRMADSLLQERGIAPVSNTVIAEQRVVQTNADAKREKHMAELVEIYGETMDDVEEEGVEPLPQELAEIVR